MEKNIYAITAELDVVNQRIKFLESKIQTLTSKKLYGAARKVTIQKIIELSSELIDLKHDKEIIFTEYCELVGVRVYNL